MYVGMFSRNKVSYKAFFPSLQDYGGYVTLMMLKATEKLIRCAAAQAPVIDWTMYGERGAELNPPAASSPFSSFISTTTLGFAESLLKVSTLCLALISF